MKKYKQLLKEIEDSDVDIEDILGDMLGNIEKKEVEYTEINVVQLVKLIQAGATIEDFIINGDINNETFSELINKDKNKREFIIEKSVIIKNCIINKIDLRSITFKNKFEIRYSHINSAIFSYSRFEKGVNFSTTVFYEQASFYGAWFFYNAYFSDSNFKCIAEFSSTYYEEWACFHSIVFEADANFGSSTFKKRGLFPSLIFKNIDFSYSRFYDFVVFGNRSNRKSKNKENRFHNIAEVSFVNSSFYDKVDFNKVSCRNLDLSNSITRDVVELTGADFDTIDLEKFRCEKLYINISQIVVNNKGERAWKIENSNNHSLQKDILLELKNNFQKLQQFDSEDWAYRESKKAELREKKQQKRYIEYFIGKYIFDFLFGFGTLPKRAFISSLFSITVFMFIYLIIGINNDLPSIFSKNFGIEKIYNYLYFTLITYTTIGYGDITPSGIAKIIAATEGLIGIFMTAIFTVTFTRKLLR